MAGNDSQSLLTPEELFVLLTEAQSYADELGLSMVGIHLSSAREALRSEMSAG